MLLDRELRRHERDGHGAQPQPRAGDGVGRPEEISTLTRKQSGDATEAAEGVRRIVHIVGEAANSASQARAAAEGLHLHARSLARELEHFELE